MISPTLEEELRQRTIDLLERTRSTAGRPLTLAETHRLHAEARRIREEFERACLDPLEYMSCSGKEGGSCR